MNSRELVPGALRLTLGKPVGGTQDGDTMRRHWIPATAATLIVLVSGCTSPATTGASKTPGASQPSPSSAPSPPANWWDLPEQTGTPAAVDWREPARYRYDLESSCNRGPSFGRFGVEVANGKVTRVKRAEPDRTADAEIPTLGELLHRFRSTKKAGGEAVLVQDPVDGHPVIVTFAMSQMGVDVAMCYRISNYTRE
jgi:hypothetical protein